MNYIKRLEADNADLRKRIENTVNDLNAFRAFLRSAKFTGTESDGSRKDWISTGDADNHLSNLRDTLNGLA